MNKHIKQIRGSGSCGSGGHLNTKDIILKSFGTGNIAGSGQCEVYIVGGGSSGIETSSKTIPTILLAIKDSIFEGLDNKLAKEFDVQFIEAIPVGVDLSGVYSKWAVRMLKRVRGSIDDRVQYKTVDMIIELMEKSKNYNYNVNNISCAVEVANAATEVTNTTDTLSSSSATTERKKQRDDLLELLRELKN